MPHCGHAKKKREERECALAPTPLLTPSCNFADLMARENKGGWLSIGTFKEVQCEGRENMVHM